MRYIKEFTTIGLNDVAQVGGKNASLGQMISGLKSAHISIPLGFAVTADAYWYYIDHNNLRIPMQALISQLGKSPDLVTLKKVGRALRKLLLHAKMPVDLESEILAAYGQLSKSYKQSNCDVAVRSSATAEDLPTASFAGQQDSFLNVQGTAELIESCKKCIASLFNDRAIIYRTEKGFDHFKIALSIGVQKMIRSDLACSGVAFSLDPEIGFKDVVTIDASYGLGESIVQGLVIPDQYIVYKPNLTKGFVPIIKKQLGDKKTKIVYARAKNNLVKSVKVDEKEINRFCLTDAEILELAAQVAKIETYYSHLKGSWSPMDVEWAKDGNDGKLYIVQARPETVFGAKKINHELTLYSLQKGARKSQILTSGQSIGRQIISAPARVIASPKDIAQVKPGEIIVTIMTNPDWVPVMKKAAGIITERGGRTCHAAIVSRELKIPAIVGAHDATKIIKNGQMITLDCSQGKTGYIYQGALKFKITKTDILTLPKLPVQLLLNMADPETAFPNSFLPVDGVGLTRIEFIMSNLIKIHPMALLFLDKIPDKKIVRQIKQLTAPYKTPQDYFIDLLAQGIGMIAAAFYPRKIIVRFSDLKTNEYRNLIGGSYFEPQEENPMLGFRGASRYYSNYYKDAFALECAAIKKVREEMGFDNVQVMIPFVRTAAEGDKVLKQMALNKLARGKNNLELLIMCEIPSNVIMIDAFSKLCDGFSIGSNDLTQLTLGVDRDSQMLSTLFDERDLAALAIFKMAIEGAQRNKKYIGICGQAPSDYPEIADFLIKCGIDSISLNADSVLPFLHWYKDKKIKH